MPVGGDLIEATFNHPTIGSGVIFFKAGEDGTFDIGGFRSNDDANMIDGGGRMIDQMNRVRPSVEGVVSWDANTAEDLEKVTQMAGDPALADWTISWKNGVVYGGKLKPVGDIQGNTNVPSFTLKLAGSDQLRKIVG